MFDNMSELMDNEAKALIELEKIAMQYVVNIPCGNTKEHLDLDSAKERVDNIMRIFIRRGKINSNKC